MSYNIFLDDERVPNNVTWIKLPSVDFVVLKSYNEFVDYITKFGVPDFVSFDHDLGLPHYGSDYSDERTGYDCAKWLRNYCLENNLQFPKYTVHSMNPVGKQRILNLLL